MLADLVLLNAKIITMNPRQPNAEAVAISGNKILAVGSNHTIKKLIGQATKTISLQGKTIIPGFIDTHIHVADFGRLLGWVNLENTISIHQLLNMV